MRSCDKDRNAQQAEVAFTLEPNGTKNRKLSFPLSLRGHHDSSVNSSHLTQCTRLDGTWKPCTVPFSWEWTVNREEHLQLCRFGMPEKAKASL